MAIGVFGDAWLRRYALTTVYAFAPLKLSYDVG